MDYIRIQANEISAIIQLTGAELTYFSAKEGVNLMWNVNDVFWNRCAPILFPIVGKLKNDKYTWNNQTYQMKQHGFARDSRFTLVEQYGHKVVLQLLSSDATKHQFPFDFQLTITYECLATGLKITHEVQNTSESDLPISFGGHPGFRLDDSLTNYKLVFPVAFTEKRWLIQHGLYTGEFEEMTINKELELNDSLFASDAIVFKNPPFQSVDLVHNTRGKLVSISCENWDAIGFWTKKEAPFFCIEPWWGWADKLDQSDDYLEKEGLYWLKANEHKTFTYQINT
jgi:galactose mutarotase-like enzyme